MIKHQNDVGLCYVLIWRGFYINPSVNSPMIPVNLSVLTQIHLCRVSVSRIRANPVRFTDSNRKEGH